MAKNIRFFTVRAIVARAVPRAYSQAKPPVKGSLWVMNGHGQRLKIGLG
jgi:hypothetical protein